MNRNALRTIGRAATSRSTAVRAPATRPSIGRLAGRFSRPMATDLVRRLVYEGLLSDEQAAAVVARRAMFGEPAPVALAAAGAATPSTVSDLLERLGYMTASRLRPSSHARALPKGMLRALWVVPIGESPEGVVVAMVDPTDAHALRELRFHLRRPIDPRAADLDALRAVVYEIDPPGDARSNTRPAPGAVPPAELDAGSWGAGSADIFEREVVGIGKPRERSATPPYGQPVVNGAASAWGRGPGEVSKLEGVTLSLPTSVSARARQGAAVTPKRGNDRPIPLRRRKSVPKVVATQLSAEALHPLAELSHAEDRDAIARMCVKALALVGERAVFFVVKKGVVQGWDGAAATVSLAGLSREALQNLWIPITARSVFREAQERRGRYEGPLTDSSADSILAAAIGGRPTSVLLTAIEVRGRIVAFLYVDNPEDIDGARDRLAELSSAAANALERVLLSQRG